MDHHCGLNQKKVKGKIVYCQGTGGDGVVLGLGGAGTIMSDEQFDDTAFPAVASFSSRGPQQLSANLLKV